MFKIELRIFGYGFCLIIGNVAQGKEMRLTEEQWREAVHDEMLEIVTKLNDTI